MTRCSPASTSSSSSAPSIRAGDAFAKPPAASALRATRSSRRCRNTTSRDESDYHRPCLIHYALSWRNTNEHLFDIAIRFVAPHDQPRLILPSWRPGKYQLQNFAANVRQWTPNLRKLGPNVWCADAQRGEEVEVRYRYWAGVLDAGSSYLDRDEAYFNGSNLFMW